MYDVITINVERSGDFERNLKEYLDDGYELKKCSCGYHGVYNTCSHWMAILVKKID